MKHNLYNDFRVPCKFSYVATWEENLFFLFVPREREENLLCEKTDFLILYEDI